MDSKKVIFILIFINILLIYAQSEKYKNIVLNKNNNLILRGTINEESVSKIIYNLTNIVENDIYIYIDSGGGDVDAGNKLIETINYYKTIKNIHCICNYAGSMAFTILQTCTYRYGTQFSRFMQHPISISLKHKSINKIKNYIYYLDSLEENIVNLQINRIKIQKNKFLENIKNDWWLTANQALKENVIDQIVNIGCNTGISDVFENIKYEFTNGNNFKIIEIFSRCPLISKPINTIYKII